MLEGTHVEILQNRIEDSAEAIKSAGRWERNGGVPGSKDSHGEVWRSDRKTFEGNPGRKETKVDKVTTRFILEM